MGGLNANQDDERKTGIVVDAIAPRFVHASGVGDLRSRELARQGGEEGFRLDGVCRTLERMVWR